MKVDAILLAFASCNITFATPSPSKHAVAPRQDALADVEWVLNDARTARTVEFRERETRGRRLEECNERCQACSNGATTKAIGEIAASGVAALALDTATLGIAAILEAAGFVACETFVIGDLQGSQANCLGLNN